MNASRGGQTGKPDPYAPPREPGEPSDVERARRAAAVSPRRNYPLAIAMALIVFALLIGVRVLWGGMGDRAPTHPEILQPPAN